MTSVDLILGVSIMLALVSVVLIVWMIVAPPNQLFTVKTDVSGSTADNTIIYYCDSSFPSSLFMIVLIVIEALLLGFNCVVVVLTRRLPSNFNESKHIAFTVTNWRYLNFQIAF